MQGNSDQPNGYTMLGKILLTISMLLLAVLWFRKQRQDERRQTSEKHQSPRTGKSSRDSGQTGGTPARTTGHGELEQKTAEAGLNDYRFAAYLFLALMIGSGTYLYYLRWQDDNTLVTVILHRDGTVAPVTYQVHKKRLEERAFTTIDGVRVTVASSERMEVIGLSPEN